MLFSGTSGLSVLLISHEGDETLLLAERVLILQEAVAHRFKMRGPATKRDQGEVIVRMRDHTASVCEARAEFQEMILGSPEAEHRLICTTMRGKQWYLCLLFAPADHRDLCATGS